jgi:hypothetical protein
MPISHTATVAVDEPTGGTDLAHGFSNSPTPITGAAPGASKVQAPMSTTGDGAWSTSSRSAAI